MLTGVSGGRLHWYCCYVSKSSTVGCTARAHLPAPPPSRPPTAHTSAHAGVDSNRPATGRSSKRWIATAGRAPKPRCGARDPSFAVVRESSVGLPAVAPRKGPPYPTGAALAKSRALATPRIGQCRRGVQRWPPSAAAARLTARATAGSTGGPARSTTSGRTSFSARPTRQSQWAVRSRIAVAKSTRQASGTPEMLHWLNRIACGARWQ